MKINRERMKQSIKVSLLSFMFLPLCYSCLSSSSTAQVTPTATPKLPLFLRLGNNKEALAVIVDDTMNNVSIDESLKAVFAPVLSNAEKLKLLKEDLTNYICQISGGSCVIAISSVRQPLTIDTTQYTTFKSQLSKTLDKFRIIAQDKADLNLIFDPAKVGLFRLITPTPAPSVIPSSVVVNTSPNPSPINTVQVSSTPF